MKIGVVVSAYRVVFCEAMPVRDACEFSWNRESEKVRILCMQASSDVRHAFIESARLGLQVKREVNSFQN